MGPGYLGLSYLSPSLLLLLGVGLSRNAKCRHAKVRPFKTKTNQTPRISPFYMPSTVRRVGTQAFQPHTITKNNLI
jgi:hypothetical protein